MLSFSKIIITVFRSINRRLFKTNWKDFRSTRPISKVFGLDRGKPVDRFYIEHFLKNNRGLIQGTVLEIGDDHYSKLFGKEIVKQEILHFTDENSNATIVGDLTKKKTLKSDYIDCFICTQTLNFIYDFSSAVEGIYYMLKENGVALVTVSGISQISRYDMDRWGDFWRFTNKSIQKIFSEVFGDDNIEIFSYGNVLASVSFLEGVASEELNKKELLYNDPNYQVIISVKAVKRLS